MAWPALALLGAAIYCGVILRMLIGWRSGFGRALVQAHGAGPSLASAALGLLGITILGVAHGFGWLPARPAVAETSSAVVAKASEPNRAETARVVEMPPQPANHGTGHGVLRHHGIKFCGTGSAAGEEFAAWPCCWPAC